MKNITLTDDQPGLKTHTDAFRRRVKRRSDKLINYFLICYFLGGFFFAFFYDTWTIALGVGGISIIAYYSVKKALPDSNLYQYVLSVVLGIFMAQYIYQMHGLFEMHFFAFIGSAILITYQNWKLQIPMLVVVVVHHLVFGYLENSGVENVYFMPLDNVDIGRFIIHFILAAAIFFICGLWGYLLNKYSEIQVAQTMKLEKLQLEALLDVKEQAVTESNNRFSYAAQATSDAIWDRNYAEEAVIWGEGYRTLFGYDINPETTSASFWVSKVHPEDLNSIKKISKEAKDNPTVNSWSGEYRFLKANGQYAFVKEKAIIIRDESGIACRTIGALQDITDSKQNEIALKKLNENLEQEKYFLDSLMDNMPDAIYFKDKESKFLRISKYLADKFGTNITNVIGKSDFDFHDDSHANEAYQDELIIQKTREPKIDYIEKEIMDDGSERWVATTKLPLINAHDEVVGTFGMSRDITKLKILEKQQHEALLDKAVAQGKFEIASGVMHDIGNAVVGFGSYLTRIKRLQEQENPDNLHNLASFFEDRKQALGGAIGEEKAGAVINMLGGMAHTQKTNREEIGKAINEQINIIANVEEILHIQRRHITGHESKERKLVDLAAIINESLSMLFVSINKMNIDVSLNLPPGLPAIKGDHTKLMQVILNVLKNNIEAFTAETAEKNICISLSKQADELVLEVKDSGNGFDPSASSQLFQKGFTTKLSGSGLGLYNCRAIIESHEGSIHISSEGRGKGSLTTIKFKL